MHRLSRSQHRAGISGHGNVVQATCGGAIGILQQSVGLIHHHSECTRQLSTGDVAVCQPDVAFKSRACGLHASQCDNISAHREIRSLWFRTFDDGIRYRVFLAALELVAASLTDYCNSGVLFGFGVGFRNGFRKRRRFFAGEW